MLFTEHSEKELIEWETKTYTCSFPDCGFSDSDPKRLERHYGKEHSIKDFNVIGDDRFYKFEDEEMFTAWRSWMSYDMDHTEIEWEGPGWYMTESFSRRCGRNCCDRLGIRTYTLEQVIGMRESELERKQEELEDLRQLKEES